MWHESKKLVFHTIYADDPLFFLAKNLLCVTWDQTTAVLSQLGQILPGEIKAKN